MTPKQFAEIGEALYGPSWRGRLATTLGVAERTIRRWEYGESSIPDGTGNELADLCRAQAKRLVSIAERL